MKKIVQIVTLALLLSTGITYTTEVKAQSVSVNFSLFQSSLSPYGRWVNHPRFGQIWITNERNFQPYQTGGHWAYTDYGWTWVSSYDWGWAPFHYGRWAYEPSYGWYWVPGYQWSPAWVAWRTDNDYYGWAPLSPGIDINISASFGSIPYDRWTFAPHRYITSPVIYRYYAPRTQNVTIIKRTTFVNNVTVRNNVHIVSGPRREDVERVNHTKIQTLTVSNSSRAGKTVVNNKTVNIYRPVINNEKVTVNNNNQKTINKNSNNTTVNKNSNNNNNNTTVKNKNTTVNNKNKTVTKNSDNKTTDKTTNNNSNNKTVNKKPVHKKPPVDKNNADQQKKKPIDNSQANLDKQKARADVQKVKASKNKQAEQRAKEAIAKRKNQDSNNRQKK